MARTPLLFLSVFIIATCGLGYELIAGTVASYLLGDSVTQFSTAIGLYLFALGIGAYLSNRSMGPITNIGGVAGVLLLASIVSATLKHAVTQGRPHAVIDNLTQRVNAWWVMVGVIGAAFVFGHTGVMLLFAFISFYALREFITLLDTRRADHPAIAAAFFLVLPLAYWSMAPGIELDAQMSWVPVTNALLVQQPFVPQHL